MKTYGLRDDQGRLYAFEVPYSLLGRRDICKVIRAIPGAKLVREPRPWWFPTMYSELCEFQFEGVTFVVKDPGSSQRLVSFQRRFWIGPKALRWEGGIVRVKEAFDRARPTGFAAILRTILGYGR